MHANSTAPRVQHSPPGRIHRRPVAGPIRFDGYPAGKRQGVFDRTQALTLTGMEKVQSYLAQQNASRKSPPGQCRITKGRRQMPKRLKNTRGSALVAVLTILIAVLLIANAAVIYLHLQTSSSTGPAVQPTEATTEATVPTTEETEPPTTTMPEPEHVVSTATILSTGDLVMHKPVFDTGLQRTAAHLQICCRLCNRCGLRRSQPGNHLRRYRQRLQLFSYPTSTVLMLWRTPQKNKL